MQFDNLLYLINLFSDLDAKATNDISSLCHWQRYPKGSEILSQQEDSTDVFFIVEGRVSAKGYSPEGKEVTYTEINRGEIFGEFSALDDMPRSASIETLVDSYVAQMSAKQFRKLVGSDPSIGLKLAEHLVRKNRYLTGRVFEFSTLAVRQRVCAELLRMIDHEKVKDDCCVIEPSPSHYSIATKLSTHREAVTRELATLAAQGVVEVGRQKISILNISHLRKITQIEV